MRSVRLILILCLTLITALLPGTAQAQGGDGQTTIHIVQRGETLYRIALQYGTSVEAIAQTNSLPNTTSIQTGQRLIIPSALVNATIPTSDQHIVQPGESLPHIALRYGSTPEIVAALNNIINPARLFVGQALDVSETAAGRIPLTHGYTHIVTPNDTLYRIAARYQTSVAAIQHTNQLSATSLIFPGQQLLIPGPESAPTLQLLPAPLQALSLTPLPPEVGRTLRIQIKSSQPVTLGGTFIDRNLSFAPEADGMTYASLYGVQALTEPGTYPLTITITDSSGQQTSFTTDIRVSSGGYGQEGITVPDEMVSLLDPDINASEYNLIANLMADHTPELQIDGPLGLPVAAPVTSSFGTRRSYNAGAFYSFHTGTDFGAPPGAPIAAPAAGIVKFVELLDIHGLYTVIDHGWGVYTAYAHQSESYVQPGQFVTAGDVIGAVGNTGRSVGPHLHWELWVNGVETDGLQWVRSSFS
jgi:murein DD-endopeptidase MepM/ murein hydrolase activator NlpD